MGRRARPILAAAAAVALAAAVLLAAIAAASGPREYQSRTVRSGPGSGAGPLSLVRVVIGQVGPDFTFAARTSGRFDSRTLPADPRRTLCLLLSHTPKSSPRRRACLAVAPHHRLELVLATIDGAGRSARAHVVGDADLRRSDARSFDVRVPPASLGIGSRFGWSFRSTWVDHGACAPTAATPVPCSSSVPASGAAAGRIVAVHPVGCTRPATDPLFYERTGARVVALTFDDGPSPYTPQVLSVLEREHVPATFFLIGQQIAAGAADVRRALGDGNVVGNHSWSHPNLAGDGSFADQQLRSTQAAIVRASGFTPCLFRPPYGASSSALVREAASLGLTTTLWSVDPRDWSRPGTGAIVSRVVSAVRPGSIVIMHDGGGPRDETVAALPTIISDLRARGYSFDTVLGLAGEPVIYGR